MRTYIVSLSAKEYAFAFMSSAYFFDELSASDQCTVEFAAEIAPLLTDWYIEQDELTLEEVIEQINELFYVSNPNLIFQFDVKHIEKVMAMLDSGDYEISDDDEFQTRTLGFND